MKLLVKQKLASLADSYDVFDEYGLIYYTVKGEVGLRHKLNILDRHDNQIAALKEEVTARKPRYQVYIGGREYANIIRDSAFLKPRFHIDTSGWNIEGDLKSEYKVSDKDGGLVARIVLKHLRMTDTYDVSVENEDDALMTIMAVLAIEILRSGEGSG